MVSGTLFFDMTLFLLRLFIIIVSSYGLGLLSKKLGYPAVIGQILAGLLVGPPLLSGFLSSNFGIELFTKEDVPLFVLSNLGMFFLMFYAGLETDITQLKKNIFVALVCALAGVMLPLIGGYYITLYFGGSIVQALLVGLGLTISALPVNAKILMDLNLMHTRMGNIIMGAAMVDDIVGLILFSSAINIAKYGIIDVSEIIKLLLWMTTFFGIMMAVGLLISYYFFPRIKRDVSKWDETASFAFVLLIIIMFGVIASTAKLNFVVGAYFAGLFLSEKVIGKELFDKIKYLTNTLVNSFLGLVFLFYLSFYVSFDVLTIAPLFVLAIIFVASLGKIIGCGVGALVGGLSFIESLSVGLAMNGRGVVELILAILILQEYEKFKIINPGAIEWLTTNQFSTLIIMTVVTTLLAPILLKAVLNYSKNKGIKIV